MESKSADIVSQTYKSGNIWWEFLGQTVFHFGFLDMICQSAGLASCLAADEEERLLGRPLLLALMPPGPRT